MFACPLRPLALVVGGFLLATASCGAQGQTASPEGRQGRYQPRPSIRRISHVELDPLPETLESALPYLSADQAPFATGETIEEVVPYAPEEMIAESITQPIDDDDMPQDEDLNSAMGVPCIPPCIAPYAIGDGLGYGGGYVIEDGMGNEFRFCPFGGRKFKASNNNSPVPRTRAYFNYVYMDHAFSANPGFVNRNINAKRYELGLEYAVMCDMASIELQVPWSDSINPNMNVTGGLNSLQDTEPGNISVALKFVAYQQRWITVSGGAGFDLPTADDLTVTDGTNIFALENQVVTVSPYASALYADPCGNIFAQGFLQFSLPLNENSVWFYDGADLAYADVEEATLLHVDASLGYWLSRDCCGGGIAGIFELHYTADLSGREVVNDSYDPVFGTSSLRRRDVDLLHATIGATLLRGCWDITPALVVPIFGHPARIFDWQAALHINRRF